MNHPPLPVLVREELPADGPAVRAVESAAFGRPEEADLVEALHANGGVVLSLVAEVTGALVGHILFTQVAIATPTGGTQAVALGPVAVHPDRQRAGVGGALIRAGLARLRQAGHRAVVLVGHPEYYPRFGFAPASRFGLRWEMDVPDEVFMALELEPGALAGCSGVVRYRPEFAAV